MISLKKKSAFYKSDISILYNFVIYFAFLFKAYLN